MMVVGGGCMLTGFPAGCVARTGGGETSSTAAQTLHPWLALGLPQYCYSIAYHHTPLLVLCPRFLPALPQVIHEMRAWKTLAMAPTMAFKTAPMALMMVMNTLVMALTICDNWTELTVSSGQKDITDEKRR